MHLFSRAVALSAGVVALSAQVHESLLVARILDGSDLYTEAMTEAQRWRAAMVEGDVDTIVAYNVPEHRAWLDGALRQPGS